MLFVGLVLDSVRCSYFTELIQAWICSGDVLLRLIVFRAAPTTPSNFSNVPISVITSIFVVISVAKSSLMSIGSSVGNRASSKLCSCICV